MKEKDLFRRALMIGQTRTHRAQVASEPQDPEVMTLKNSIENRLQRLEKKTKPPVISTLADLVIWCAEHEDDPEDAEIELSPEMHSFVDDFLTQSEEQETPLL